MARKKPVVETPADQAALEAMLVNVRTPQLKWLFHQAAVVVVPGPPFVPSWSGTTASSGPSRCPGVP
jgi:hypothetical protein